MVKAKVFLFYNEGVNGAFNWQMSGSDRFGLK